MVLRLDSTQVTEGKVEAIAVVLKGSEFQEDLLGPQEA